jgi:hypothetical protein
LTGGWLWAFERNTFSGTFLIMLFLELPARAGTLRAPKLQREAFLHLSQPVSVRS